MGRVVQVFTLCTVYHVYVGSRLDPLSEASLQRSRISGCCFFFCSTLEVGPGQVCCTMCPVNLSPFFAGEGVKGGTQPWSGLTPESPGMILTFWWHEWQHKKKTNPRRHYELILDTFMGSVGIFCTGRYWLLLLLFGGGPPHRRCWWNVYDGEYVGETKNSCLGVNLRNVD